MSRRNLWIPDDLYERVKQAAREAAVQRGEHVTTAAWIREACEEKLEREITGERVT